MTRRIHPPGAARHLAVWLAFAAAGALVLGGLLTADAQAAPAGTAKRPAARDKTPASTAPRTPANSPTTPRATPPRRKATPRATPPRRKARPVVPPKTKRAVARRRPDLRPRLPESRRPGVTPEDKTPDEKEPVEKTMRKLQGAAWAMVGITAVLLTFTGVFALMVEDREDEMERLASFVDPYSNPPLQPLTYEGRTKRDFEQYKKEGRVFGIVGFTFLGLSAAAAIAATTLFVLDHVTKKKKKEKSSLKVLPVIGPRGGGVSLGLEF